MQNRLTELIYQRQDCGLVHNSKGQDFVTYNVDLAAHLIANGVTIQKWIPVTERLPESQQKVIVCRKNGKVEQGVYLGVNGWWKVYGTNTKAVTHWMPLPEPPKEDTP